MASGREKTNKQIVSVAHSIVLSTAWKKPINKGKPLIKSFSSGINK
jgi:hypothetical protein